MSSGFVAGGRLFMLSIFLSQTARRECRLRSKPESGGAGFSGVYEISIFLRGQESCDFSSVNVLQCMRIEKVQLTPPARKEQILFKLPKSSG